MTDVEPIADRINMHDFKEQREQDARWQELAERIAGDDRAAEHLRDLMNRYVGAPDPIVRRQEGLPAISKERFGVPVQYTEEVCAMVSDRGNVIYVRTLDESQRWHEDVQPWYSDQDIFERGKNLFVIEGPLLSDRGLQESTVAQHRAFTAGDGTHQYYHMQSLPPEAFNQPYIPIHGSMTDLPWRVSIQRTPDGTRVSYAGELRTERFRPIDAEFVDMVAVARAQHAPALDAIAS